MKHLFACLAACLPVPTILGQTLLGDLNPASLPGAVLLSAVGQTDNATLFQVHAPLGAVLWRTDGTPAGTRAVTDAVPGRVIASGSLGDRCVFAVDAIDGRRAVWASDGSNGGTEQLAQVDGAAEFVVMSKRAYFLGGRGGTLGLWRTDGTPGGTTLVAATPPPSGGLRTAAGFVLFLAQGDVWQSNGTAPGTLRATFTGTVAQIEPMLDGVVLRDASAVSLYRPGPRSTTPLWSGVSNKLFGASGQVFLFSDAGQLRRVDLSGATSVLMPAVVVDDAPAMVLGRNVLFIQSAPGGRGGAFTLHASDGGTPVPLAQVGARGFSYPRVVRVTVAHAAIQVNSSGGLVVSDGTPAGTQMLPPFYYASGGPADLYGYGVAARGLIVGQGARLSRFLLAIETPLFDGSSVRQAVGSLSNPAAYPPLVSPVVVANGSHAMFFAKTAGGNDRRVFATDGTAAGTVEFPGFAGFELLATPRRFYFTASSGLYATDATRAGTWRLVDFANYGVRNLMADGDEVIAIAARVADDRWARIGADGSVTVIPFSVSGQTAAQPLVTARGAYVSVLTGVFGPRSLEFLPRGGTVSQRLPGIGYGLLGSTGTHLIGQDAPAVRALDLGTGQVSTLVASAHVTAVGTVGGLVFFGGEGGLWRTDGTLAGTLQLTSAKVTSMTALGGSVLFAGETVAEGSELWRSDGTVAGTRMLRDLREGAVGSVPTDLTAIGNRVVFSADVDKGRRELWQTDGTAAGTEMLLDMVAPGSSSPTQFAAVGDKLFFWAQDEAVGMEPRVLPLRRLGAPVVSRLTSGCAPSDLDVLASPQVGAAGFGVACNALPGAAAVALVGVQTATVPVALGAQVCDLRLAGVAVALPAVVAGGRASLAMPIPAVGSLVGRAVVVQMGFTTPALGSAVLVVIGR